ncbi:TPA: O-antigen ligase family protein [Raoultella ornithinolytica]|nr:O-antigen ligase family protein [Raoultella ornithinolytica]
MLVNGFGTTNKCESFTIWSIVILSILGATYIAKLLPVSETGLLEVIFLLSSILALITTGINKNALFISNALLIYLFYSFVSVILITHANLLDFVQAYKSYYYFILLGAFYKKEIFSEEVIEKIFKFLLLVFLVKYSLDKFVLKIDRPTVLIENNFELILLILLYYYVNIIKKDANIINTLLMLFVCIISGSRSSLIAMMIAILFSFDRRLDIKKIVMMTLIPLAVLGIYMIFQSRLEDSGGSSYEQIDRYRFFLEFLSSTSDWPWWKFFIGSTALTPLSATSCANLSYYQLLFSYSGDGKCYSVILHSFLLRVIYDHGFFGFIALITVLCLFLNKFSLKSKICIISILMATAMSVSSLNNVYVSLALVFFIGAEKNYRVINGTV